MPTSTTTADLSRLTQSQVSWLIGKPTSWLRTHGDLFSRDGDGKYDAREVFARLAEIQTAEPAALSEADATKARRLADIFVGCIDWDSREVLTFLDGVKRRYGTAGLLSVMAAFVADLEDVAKLVTPPDRSIWDA